MNKNTLLRSRNIIAVFAATGALATTGCMEADSREPGAHDFSIPADVSSNDIDMSQVVRDENQPTRVSFIDRRDETIAKVDLFVSRENADEIKAGTIVIPTSSKQTETINCDVRTWDTQGETDTGVSINCKDELVLAYPTAVLDQLDTLVPAQQPEYITDVAY